MSIFEADKDFNIIWNECQDSIRKLCEIKLSSSPDSAKDVFSDVYIAYADAIKSGKKITYPKAWIYKVTNNLIIKKYEELRIQREKTVSFDETFAEMLSLAIKPEMTDTIITDEDIHNMADEIMSSLSEEEQKMLKYFHNDNMSLREISQLLGKSESAVKQQHYRLCKKIRKVAIERIDNY